MVDAGLAKSEKNHRLLGLHSLRRAEQRLESNQAADPASARFDYANPNRRVPNR